MRLRGGPTLEIESLSAEASYPEGASLAETSVLRELALQRAAEYLAQQLLIRILRTTAERERETDD